MKVGSNHLLATTEKPTEGRYRDFRESGSIRSPPRKNTPPHLPTMKKSNVAHSPVAPALLLVFSAAITTSHAFPFLDEDVYAAESRNSVIDPTLGRRMGQDFPEHFAGKDYTTVAWTWPPLRPPPAR
jgi:hypothetical protein